MKNQNQWFCGAEGQQYGPFTWEQMRGMAAEGRLVADSFVRREVDQQWFKASQIPGLLPKAHAGASSKATATATAAPQAAAKAARTKPSDSATVTVGSQVDTVRATPKRPKAVPVGKPVSHSSGQLNVGPVAAKPVGAAAPQVAPPTTPAFPTFVTQPAAVSVGDASAAPGAAPPEPVKKSSPIVLVAALGGAIGLVALVGVGLVVWKYTRPAPRPEAQIAGALDKEFKQALEKVAKELEGNPAGVPIDGEQMAADLQPLTQEMAKAFQQMAADGQQKAGGATAAPASQAAQAKLVNSIRRWNDASRAKIKLNDLQFRIVTAWLAADESGRRVNPTPSGQTSAEAKYVFVELNLLNTAPVPRKYKSWNVAGGDGVALADQANQVLALVPVSATPAVTRLSVTDIQPGQSIKDVLVFTSPQGTVEKLKLALAKASLAEGAKFRNGSHFALELPLEMLLTGAESAPLARGDGPIAASIPAAIGPAAEPAAIIAPAAEGEPPAVAAAAPPEMKKPNQPPTAEELNRQFEEFSKAEKDKAEKDKGDKAKGEPGEPGEQAKGEKEMPKKPGKAQK